MTRRPTLRLLPLVFLAGCGPGAGGPDTAGPGAPADAPHTAADTVHVLGPADGVEPAPGTWIHRDQWGVPHVLAPTDRDAVFGMAWAMAEDDWPLIEANYIAALGRAAEVDGPEAVPQDWAVRAMEIPRLSRAEYDRATPRLRCLLDAYADGLNAFLDEHPDRGRILRRVEPWYPLALIRLKYHFFEFIGYAGLDTDAWLRLAQGGWPGAGPGAGEAIPGFALELGHGLIPRIPPGLVLADRVHGPLGDRPLGSNQIALAPSRTVSGNAMLLINPHQSFVGVQRYGEIHLHSDEGLVFSGLTGFGFVLPYMGHNERLGWAYTDNYADIGDVYRLTIPDPERPLRYRWASGSREATTWMDTLLVRTAAGALESQPIRLWKSHHGPVLGLDEQGHPLAVRVATLEEGGWFDQWDAMIRADDREEWLDAVARLNVSYMNVMYADADGNIGYIYGSRVARRDPAFDYSGVIDGSDPRLAWEGFHSLDELPMVWNPPSGWLLNTNSSPFVASSTLPYEPGDFPAYMVGDETENARAVSARRLVRSMENVTFDEFAARVWDTRLSAADSLVPALVDEWDIVRERAEADALGPAAALARTPHLAAAVERIAHWDRRAAIPSVETTWFVLASERAALAADTATTATGRHWPAVRALAEALTLLQTEWGTPEVPWGDLNRIQRPLSLDDRRYDPDRPSHPVAGAPSGLGSLFVYHVAPFGSPQPRNGVHGNSYVAVIELGDPVRARSILNYGQSGDPGSPHFFDQAALYSARRFKPAYFHPDTVRSHARSGARVDRGDGRR